MINPRSILAAVLVLAGIGGTVSAGLSIARSNAAQSGGDSRRCADRSVVRRYTNRGFGDRGAARWCRVSGPFGERRGCRGYGLSR
jgi:hypothetical protein